MTVLAGSYVQPKPRCKPRPDETVSADPCGGSYWLDCWCGWRGETCRTPEAAVEAWQEHADQEGRQ